MADTDIAINIIRGRIEEVRQLYKWTENSISKDSATQKRLNRQLSHGGTITLETILLILEACPEVSADWLLLGRGEMLSSTKGDDAGNPGNETVSRFLALLEKKDEQMDRLIDMLSRH